MNGIRAAVLLTFAAALGWALLDLLRRFLAGRVAALALVAWVTIGAVPPLLVWVLVSPGSPADRGYVVPALASISLNVVANFAYFRSLQLSALSTTLPMLAFTPTFAALLGALFLGERIGARGIFGLVLVVAGALLLTLGSGRGLARLVSGIRRERGARWMIGVAFLWAVTLMLDKKALGHAPAQLHALVLNCGVAAGALTILALRRDLSALKTMRGSWGLLLATVLVSAAALGAQFVALGGVELGFLETIKRGIGGILAVLFGRAFFSEPVTPAKLAAVSLMTVGVGLMVL